MNLLYGKIIEGRKSQLVCIVHSLSLWRTRIGNKLQQHNEHYRKQNVATSLRERERERERGCVRSVCSGWAPIGTSIESFGFVCCISIHCTNNRAQSIYVLYCTPHKAAYLPFGKMNHNSNLSGFSPQGRHIESQKENCKLEVLKR